MDGMKTKIEEVNR